MPFFKETETFVTTTFSIHQKNRCHKIDRRAALSLFIKKERSAEFVIERQAGSNGVEGLGMV